MTTVTAQEVGQRVRAERQRLGLTERTLARRTELLSQPTLHRIEAGERDHISVGELDALATALGVSMQALLGADPLRERVLAAARATEAHEQEAEEAVAAACDLIELEERMTRVGVDGPQRPALPKIALGSRGAERQGRTLGETVRERWGLGLAPIGDIQDLIEAMTGVDVAIIDLPPSVSGLCVTEQTAAVAVIVANSAHSAERQRFTLAHELGHLLSGDPTRVFFEGRDETTAEKRAQAFARNLLLPPGGLEAWCARAETSDFDEASVAALAWHFGVSIDAALVQLHRLGLVTGAQQNMLSGLTARGAALRYGWYPQWCMREEQAHTRRLPRRLWQRGLRAYEAGAIGVGALAGIARTEPNDLRRELAGEGITPAEPRPVVIDREALLARGVGAK